MPDADGPGQQRASAAERHRRLKEIVLAADRLHGADRERFLAAACAGDEELARSARGVLGEGAVATDDVAPAGVAARAGGEEVPARLGAFRILRRIGSGGMGVVYEAIDERDGRRVAVKAIHAHLLGNARVEERFAREAAAGAQVVHPNVVRTLGAMCVEDCDGPGRNVLVTEFVEGRTLRDLVRSLGRVPESLLREIARGIAQGLGAIHAAGIVHRDLKPENVMLTSDSRVRVMDLGVARLLDSGDGLTRDGDFVGSIEYASPEQCEGRAAGPAADLYAAGVVLYELASGANPFARGTSLATVAAHLTHVPPAPPDLSPFFASVVAALLAKDPDRRFASAAELAAALDEAEEGSWWRAHAAGAAAPGPPAPRVPVTRDLALHGRSRELSSLFEALASAREGRATTVLLTGEAGLGKSRLLDEFLRANDAAGTCMGYGAIPPTGGPAGLTDALLAVVGGTDAVAWLTARAELPEALAVSLAAYLRREPPPAASPALAADAVQAALLRALRARARERPVVLAVDDVHDAGPDTGTLLLSLARGLAADRVLLVLAGRPHPRPRWTADLAALAGFRAVVLSRLSSGDIAEILRDALRSDDLAMRAARRIAAKSGGVPLYVAAMAGALRDAVAASPVSRRARVIDEVGVPMALREAVASRLSGLAPDERTLLDACAVQGAWFDADTAAAVLGVPLVRVLQTLADLERRAGVVHAEGRRFRFDHQLLAEETAAALPAPLAEEYHLRTAHAIAARAKPRASPEELAVHYVASSRPELALPQILPALDALTARHENDVALGLARRALAREGLLAGAARAEVVLRIAGLHNLACNRAEEAAAAAEALALAREARDARLLGRAFGAVGTHLVAVGEHRRSLAPLRAAVRLGRRSSDRTFEVWSTTTLGTSLTRLGRLDEVRERLASLERLLGNERGTLVELMVRRAAAVLALSEARHDDARAAFERCLELGRMLGSPRAQGPAEWGLGIVDMHEGEWESARARFLRSRDAGRAIGERTLEVHVLGNVALCSLAQGAWLEAAATLGEMRSMADETGDPTALPLLLVNLAYARSWVGDREGAQAAADEAAAVVGAAGYPRVRAYVALCRAEMAQERGDPAAARDLLREAHADVRAAGDRAAVVDTLVALARTSRESGDEREAIRFADEACAVAATLGRSASRMVAAAARAALPGGDPAAARAIVDEFSRRATVSQRMRARLDLYRTTGDRDDLAVASGILGEALARLPADLRDAAVARVRLHREIAEACRREGLPPPR